MILIKNLSKVYGSKTVIKNVSMQFEKDVFMALLVRMAVERRHSCAVFADFHSRQPVM